MDDKPYRCDKTIDFVGYEIPKGWGITLNPKPIPSTAYDYDFWHENVDNENGLCGTASSIEDAIEQIKEMENE